MLAVDVPPMPIAAQELVIMDGLRDCGLSVGGVSAKYEDELEAYVITISTTAGATEGSLKCIQAVAGAELVVFEDQELSRAYDEQQYADVRKEMFAEAEKGLRARGLWEGLPRRADFMSNALFAVALERHCGFAPGSILKAAGEEITVLPQAFEKAQYEKVAGLMAAITYTTAGSPSAKFGFVGNEAFTKDH